MTPKLLPLTIETKWELVKISSVIFIMYRLFLHYKQNLWSKAVRHCYLLKARAMIQWLRLFFQRTKVWFPDPIWWLTTFCYYSFMGSDIFFWLPPVLHVHDSHIYMQAKHPMCINWNNKIKAYLKFDLLYICLQKTYTSYICTHLVLLSYVQTFQYIF